MKLTGEERTYRDGLLRGSPSGVLRLARQLGVKVSDERDFTRREWPEVLADRIIRARRATKPGERGAA